MNNVSLDPRHQLLPSIPFLFHIRSHLYYTAGESTAFHQLMQLQRKLMRVKLEAHTCQLMGQNGCLKAVFQSRVYLVGCWVGSFRDDEKWLLELHEKYRESKTSISSQ